MKNKKKGLLNKTFNKFKSILEMQITIGYNTYLQLFIEENGFDKEPCSFDNYIVLYKKLLENEKKGD